ncbi:stage II sporulation protein R [Clostridium perfringens]|uniref:stage II sporulation protein R n=1 Tax=Clostridium perfringens TaxID=1502 RepID=UPI001CDF6A8F|nr:stage II sporulation protein R [Clostridium perfringens]EGT0695683.1 stage II sporulation protein R [Clostridium perfringens]EGT3603646.1 stage II sporulation protein R [Clostridium perfringens]MDH5083933.1 Stage II sporulation protein R (sporeIIR) [Clostridium perfringens]HBJ6024776.1 stage II sporulation protein R [Clostridium perfringens]HBJ6108587.1 stage II sporulation protein R [Clostridium perfringens]
MKKILSVLFLGVICLFIVGSSLNIKQALGVTEENVVEDISEKLIRFHVLANSDSDIDQDLKLRVKDEVLKYISPILNESQSLEESREILKREDKNIIKIAEDYIKSQGFDYTVKTTLTRENFPVKEYGNIVLPQGEYEAYRILIGEGKGQNWWCVMFPPLCFIDVTKGQVAYDETEKKMKDVLSEEEFKSVNKKENNVNFEFKVIDLFK